MTIESEQNQTTCMLGSTEPNLTWKKAKKDPNENFGASKCYLGPSFWILTPKGRTTWKPQFIASVKCFTFATCVPSIGFYIRGIPSFTFAKRKPEMASRDGRTVKFFSPNPVLSAKFLKIVSPIQSWSANKNHRFLFCLMRQNNYSSYLAFSQIRLVEGKIVPEVLLPHEAK